MANAPLAKQLEINDWTHTNGVHFISAESRGLFGYVVSSLHGISNLKMLVSRSVFTDFGPKFTCVDPTGEQPLTGMIVSAEKVDLYV